MKDEIKEMLQYVIDDIYQCGEYIDQAKKLEKVLDYITNLQEENEKLKKKLDCKERLTKIMPEDTEFIILSKADYDRQENDIELAALDYKSRNEKAIEYITSEEYFDLNNRKTGSFSEDSKNYFKAHDKLLNILQGEDKDD